MGSPPTAAEPRVQESRLPAAAPDYADACSDDGVACRYSRYSNFDLAFAWSDAIGDVYDRHADLCPPRFRARGRLLGASFSAAATVASFAASAPSCTRRNCGVEQHGPWAIEEPGCPPVSSFTDGGATPPCMADDGGDASDGHVDVDAGEGGNDGGRCRGVDVHVAAVPRCVGGVSARRADRPQSARMCRFVESGPWNVN